MASAQKPRKFNLIIAPPAETLVGNNQQQDISVGIIAVVPPAPPPVQPKPVRQPTPPRPSIDQSYTVYRIATECPPYTWEEVFQAALPELKDISDILVEDAKVHGMFFPLMKNLFRAFELTRLDEVKIILLGQDPYHQILPSGLPRAQGVSFSVSPSDNIPSSLKNMFLELEKTVAGFRMPYHGDLTTWARRGVLLLNSCLTVRCAQANSHKELWMGFIVKVIDAVIKRCPHTVFILLGKEAQKILEYVPDKCPIVTAAHPSGLSARRGFFGSDVFNKANAHLIAKCIEPVDWTLPLHA